MEQTNDNQLQGAEILFGFVAWLTTRYEPTTMSAQHTTTIEHIKRFCEANGLSMDCREDWADRLTHPPVLPGEVTRSTSEKWDPEARIADLESKLKRSLAEKQGAERHVKDLQGVIDVGQPENARLRKRLADLEAEGQSDKAKLAIEASS